jgi:hypothetical protein
MENLSKEAGADDRIVPNEEEAANAAAGVAR